jgi:hypothetical protein
MHAAGPLFFPTMSERRSAQAKEVKRVNSRRRRHNVRMWVSTPVGSDNDSDDEEEDTMSPMLSPMASPLRRKNDNTTPVGRVLDWSTF